MIFAQSAIETVQDIEANLVALTPLVILISSFVLGPEAGDTAKKVVPLAVSAVVTLLTFVVTEFPGSGGEAFINILGNVLLLTGIAVAVYSSLSGVLKPLLGGRSLNEATGPGLVGRR